MPSLRRSLPRLPRRLTVPVSHRARFVAIAALVVYGDLVTKRLAIALWSAESYPLVGRLVQVGVVYNRLGAFSTSLGRHTWSINVAATIVAVLLAIVSCHRLALVDEEAPATLGLIAGAGLGNLASLVGSSAGVPDFLSVTASGGRDIVMNVADLAAMLGLACSVRLVVVLLRAIVAAGRVRRATP